MPVSNLGVPRDMRICTPIWAGNPAKSLLVVVEEKAEGMP
jgi:hypothetical protein